MINGKSIVVIIPAFNAGKTLERVWEDIPHDIVDDIVLGDDASSDNTVAIAKALKIKHIICHKVNRGYGANQKSCYAKALALGADIVVMIHADYQYTPKLIRAMASVIADTAYSVVFASRMLGNGARPGGMPIYKYVANRSLTLFQNFLVGQCLSEYHTGFRAFSRDLLLTLPLEKNSDAFIFDNQMVLQILYRGYEIAEITCPTRYAADSSTITFLPSLLYGLQVAWLSFRYLLNRLRICRMRLLDH